MSDTHDQSQAIAAFLCPLLRAHSHQVIVHRIASPDDKMFETAYRTLQFLKVRKKLFQGRCDYVFNSILYSETIFEMTYPAIELYSHFPKEGHWTGAGAYKEHSAAAGKHLQTILEPLIGESALGPNAIVQIDITSVWTAVSPFLESLNKNERDTERQKYFENIPKYTDPEDPEAVARRDALLEKYRPITPPDSDDDNIPF